MSLAIFQEVKQTHLQQTSENISDSQEDMKTAHKIKGPFRSLKFQGILQNTNNFLDVYLRKLPQILKWPLTSYKLGNFLKRQKILQFSELHEKVNYREPSDEGNF